MDRASFAGRLLTPAAMRAQSEAFGRAILAWPRLWEFCREQS
jgi:hypothetical protein